jgi:hypothetical protein
MHVVASRKKGPEKEVEKVVRNELDLGMVGEAEAGAAGEHPAEE